MSALCSLELYTDVLNKRSFRAEVSPSQDWAYFSQNLDITRFRVAFNITKDICSIALHDYQQRRLHDNQL